MEKHQQEFIELAIKHEVLCFGDFTLKSGRQSPYFFNAGKFSSGTALATIGRCYAQAIVDSGIVFDMLFGPAYKGIPLVAAIAVALAEHHQLDFPYGFNRKEKKTHGEGGELVGAEVHGQRVLIVDDVITAGTAIREVMDLLAAQGAEAAGVVIGLDRQEKGKGELSAVQEVSEQFAIDVVSVINLQTVVDFLQQQSSVELASLQRYQQSYGISISQ